MTLDISEWFRGSPSTGLKGGQRQLLLQDQHDFIFGRRLQKENKNAAEGEREVAEDDDDGFIAGEGAGAAAEEEEEEATPEDPEVDLSKTRIDLVKLVPFDVKLSLLPNSESLNTFALTDLVTDWMDEGLAAEVKRMEMGLSHSAYDSVILEERSVQPSGGGRRQLRQRSMQQQADHITVASYEGVTLWKHTVYSDLEVVTPSLVEDLERQALLKDDRLLELLQASPAQGLGAAVTDVRAYINPNPTGTTTVNTPQKTSNDTTNANLELIIVVAIVVACMAFCFLVFSLFWAWRFDQQRRQEAYRVEHANDNTSPSKAASRKRKPRSPDGTGGTDKSEDDDTRTPPNVVSVNHNNADDDTALEYPDSAISPTTGNYPESVISDDISTSLTAYYRSGMGSRPIFTPRALPGGPDDFNDQASFSSMESYGYSLDGYAPSLGGYTYSKTAQPNTKFDKEGDREAEE